jgi:hypothetical protein
MDHFEVGAFWDEETQVWYAINDDIPLALESPTLDGLAADLLVTVPELLALNFDYSGPAEIHLVADRQLQLA